MRASRARLLAFWLPPALAPLSLWACINAYPQRLPGPLVVPGTAEGGEAAAAPVAGATPAAPEAVTADGSTVTIQRDSDPVWVRRPGERGDRQLQFHRKRERLAIGSLVRTGAGGRAELLWSPDATTLALFDEGRVTLGDPARDEPVLRFHSLSRALLMLTPEDRVEVVGGARLAGDPLENTGPILLESVPGSILRVSNQSKHVVTLTCRDERLELGPGESLDLPVMVGGSAPTVAEGEPERFELPAFGVAFRGRVERRDEGAGVSLTALEPSRVRALGIEVQLEASETARFSGLTQVRGAPPADPSAKP